MLKVKIKNFQSVADTEFEVDGFTVIVGKNNRGKSAIVRAIDAALSNRLGNDFIRWGKLQTEVDLVKDGLDISWIKGETSSYKIKKTGDNEAKPYTSLNRSVPGPIIDAGFRKFEVADEKLNPLIAHQFEELFLINRSGPFVTEALSTLYDLNDINDADTLCQKKLRASKGLLKTRNTDVESLSKKIKKFEGLNEVKKNWVYIKNLIEKVNLLKTEILELDQFIFKFGKHSVLVKKLQETIKIKFPDINPIEKQISDYSWIIDVQKKYAVFLTCVQKLQKTETLKIPVTEKHQQLITEFNWLEETITKFQQILKTVQKLKEVLLLIIPDTQKISVLIQEVSDINLITSKLKEIVFSCDKYRGSLSGLKNIDSFKDRINNIEDKVSIVSYLFEVEKDFSVRASAFKELRIQYDTAVQEWTTAKTELETFKICPLCNNPLTPADHNHG